MGEYMAHYFENDDTLKSNIQKNDVIINHQKFIFYTDNGVFSKKGLDFGTRSLLEILEIDKIKGKVLDFGCGYGPIGIYVAQNTDTEVHMIDVNRRSLELARKNVSINHVNVQIYESNLYENVKDTFDFIISNPPIRVGKKVLYQILEKARKYLRPNGELWIVIHKDQGAKSTMKFLKQFYIVELKNKNKGFYIIQCKEK